MIFYALENTPIIKAYISQCMYMMADMIVTGAPSVVLKEPEPEG
jgi:hypothetical protein